MHSERETKKARNLLNGDMFATFCTLYYAPPISPNDLITMKILLEAVHKNLTEEPLNGAFGMSRVALPHGKNPIKEPTASAYRGFKLGYRSGIFAYPTVPRKTTSGFTELLPKWYLGEIPVGERSRSNSFNPIQLLNEVIEPSFRFQLKSPKESQYRSIKVSNGWIYQVMTKKVFATSDSCLKCHSLKKPSDPIAVIGLVRTSWPMVKKIKSKARLERERKLRQEFLRSKLY